ncbi:MAG: hypothetical protein BZY82_04580 [SAR202 cluster bacterium Io17-Chloro-G3]|nr:MAG: hypothetical protein BZY82_04580 [SAR202 cluster bacterium Io17-Chloro-G3]
MLDTRKWSDLDVDLIEVYQLLHNHYGPQHWWPGEGPFETIVGAILTQNTAWHNAECALANLKEADALRPDRIRNLTNDELATLIKPSRYFNAKAKKLKAFVEVLGQRHQDDLEHFFSQELDTLRQELLSIYGIGPETADDIILYAAQKPSFVIDTYTKRVIARLTANFRKQSYTDLQRFFHENLPNNVSLYNEYHALLDHHAKVQCQKKPSCIECCLLKLCRTGLETPPPP